MRGEGEGEKGEEWRREGRGVEEIGGGEKMGNEEGGVRGEECDCMGESWNLELILNVSYRVVPSRPHLISQLKVSIKLGKRCLNSVIERRLRRLSFIVVCYIS